MSETSFSAGRRIVDSLTYVSDAVTLAGAQPTKLVTSWMMDRIAPAYWIPNSKLTVPVFAVFSHVVHFVMFGAESKLNNDDDIALIS